MHCHAISSPSVSSTGITLGQVPHAKHCLLQSMVNVPNPTLKQQRYRKQEVCTCFSIETASQSGKHVISSPPGKMSHSPASARAKLRNNLPLKRSGTIWPKEGCGPCRSLTLSQTDRETPAMPAKHWEDGVEGSRGKHRAITAASAAQHIA